MTRKQIGRNAWNLGRISVFESELEQLCVEICDAVDVDVVDAKKIAYAIIENKDSEEFLTITPA